MEIKLLDYIPSPCKRPRFGSNGSVYSPSKNGEELLSWIMCSKVAALKSHDPIPLEGNLAITIVIYHKAKSLRGDVDNLAKFVMDASQKAGIVKNDCQYRSLSIKTLPGKENLTVITIDNFDEK